MAKKVTLTIVVEDEADANILAKEMTNSYIAQQGIFTLECGGIYDLTAEDKEEVESQCPHLTEED
jgi:hypothetical protein